MSESKSIATPEQIAAFQALLQSFTDEQRAAVVSTWKAAQTFGYRTASKEVFAKAA